VTHAVEGARKQAKVAAAIVDRSGNSDAEARAGAADAGAAETSLDAGSSEARCEDGRRVALPVKGY